MSNFKEYMGLFLAEMDEQIEMLNRFVLDLEKNNEDFETVNKLFRIAHTLKASSATMGFQMISELTHKMENILDEVRNQRLEVSTKLVDTIFACLDRLQQWRAQLMDGDENLAPADDLIDIFNEIKSQKEAAAKENVKQLEDIKIFKNAETYEQKGWWLGTIKIIVDSSSQMPGVRAFLAYSKAKEWGEILSTNPDVNELSDGSCEGVLTINIALPSEEDLNNLRNSLLNLTEIAEVTVVPFEINKDIEPQIANNNFAAETESTQAKKITERTGDESSKNVTNETHSKPAEGNEYLRIEASKLDELMNLLGELVIDRARLNQIEYDLVKSYGGEKIESLSEVSRHLSLVTGELQDCLLKLRMSPMANVYGRLPRIVRDLSHQLGKEVELVLEGEDTELDRTVIQNIYEPLVHLIRNALDHGLENPADRQALGKSPTGKLLVRAEQQGGEIVISVRDDGRGIDPEIVRNSAVEKGLVSLQEARAAKDGDALQWIFEPGFSTRKEVSEISGRGVGMDVVKHKVEAMQGRIEIDSEIGVGTTIKITLPLTLAVIRALLVDVGGYIYTIPLANVLETLRVPKTDVQQLGLLPAIVVRGKTLPLIDLRKWCGVKEEGTEKDISVVLVASGTRYAGLIVDTFIGEEEVVVKSLDKFLGRLRGFSGATLLGDGSVSLIFDIAALLNEIHLVLRDAV